MAEKKPGTGFSTVLHTFWGFSIVILGRVTHAYVDPCKAPCDALGIDISGWPNSWPQPPPAVKSLKNCIPLRDYLKDPVSPEGTDLAVLSGASIGFSGRCTSEGIITEVYAEYPITNGRIDTSKAKGVVGSSPHKEDWVNLVFYLDERQYNKFKSPSPSVGQPFLLESFVRENHLPWYLAYRITLTETAAYSKSQGMSIKWNFIRVVPTAMVCLLAEAFCK